MHKQTCHGPSLVSGFGGRRSLAERPGSGHQDLCTNAWSEWRNIRTPRIILKERHPKQKRITVGLIQKAFDSLLICYRIQKAHLIRSPRPQLGVWLLYAPDGAQEMEFFFLGFSMFDVSVLFLWGGCVLSFLFFFPAVFFGFFRPLLGDG